MQATKFNSNAEHALTLDQIEYALDQIKDRKAVLIETSIARRNWSAGYAVEVNGGVYWFPRGTAVYFRMPDFVRSEEDALNFIQSAEGWYTDGVSVGVEYARNRMRRWVNDKLLSEL